MTSTRQNDDEKTPTLLYIPPKVKPEKLFVGLDEKTIEKIEKEINDPNNHKVANYIKKRLNGNKFGRYPKKLFGIKYGIVYGKHGLYAIYKEGNKQIELADPGKFGKVKLIKNLHTHEWFVLKTQMLEIPSKNSYVSAYLIALFKNEHDILDALGLSHEPLMTRRSTKDDELLKGYFLMQYAKGDDLYTILNRKTNKAYPMSRWPELFWLHLCIRITEAFVKNNNRSVLHGDIKLENIIYDITNDIIHIVDFGNAQKKITDSVKLTNYLIQGFNAPENFSNHYSEKSEVYALSNIFEIFLCHKVPEVYKGIKKTENDAFKEPRFVSYGKKTLFASNNQIVNFLKQMRNYSADKRPTLEETLIYLKSTYNRYLEQENFKKDAITINQILENAAKDEVLRLKEVNQILEEQKNNISSEYCSMRLFKSFMNPLKIFDKQITQTVKMENKNRK